ncbi:hypothetical protein KH5_10690 [Urechidicola sp. KH5]
MNEVHKAGFIKSLEVFFVACRTAKNETPKKRKSKLLHHAGVDAQPCIEHELATNKNGVIKQCIIQRVLAKAPKISGLLRAILKFINVNATELQI